MYNIVRGFRKITGKLRKTNIIPTNWRRNSHAQLVEI
jgi:hypothetical protein